MFTGVLRPLNTASITRKRKRRSSFPHRAPFSLNSSFNKSGQFGDDVSLQFTIDDSSPVKKVKRSHNDNSHWFLSVKYGRRLSNSRRSSNGNFLADQDSLSNQLKRALQQERSKRESWLHATTSKLKNKIKESLQVRTTVTIKLGRVETRYGLTLSQGFVQKAELLEDGFIPDEEVKILFPATLASSMDLSYGTIIKLTSPWKACVIDGVKHIINPFWIAVVNRSNEPTSTPEETTIFEWTCPCRESLGEIDPLNCGKDETAGSPQASQDYPQSQCQSYSQSYKIVP